MRLNVGCLPPKKQKLPVQLISLQTRKRNFSVSRIAYVQRVSEVSAVLFVANFIVFSARGDHAHSIVVLVSIRTENNSSTFVAQVQRYTLADMHNGREAQRPKGTPAERHNGRQAQRLTGTTAGRG